MAGWEWTTASSKPSIKIKRLPRPDSVNHDPNVILPVLLSVDASETGTGNLEIMVNGGRVPCNVENRGKKKFVASFVPENIQTHTIEMNFNDIPVAGSPWHVDVADSFVNDVIEPRAPKIKRLSHHGLKHLPMRKPVSFLIETDSLPADDLDVVITSPSGREVACELYPEKTGFRVEYTPLEVGSYTVQVFFAGSPVSEAPLTMKTYDRSSIQVSKVPNGFVDKPIEFYIDVTKAGEGRLEIMVNNGNIPNTVVQQRTGVYKVYFIPEEPGIHYIDISFNGEELPGTPYTCQVLDTSHINLEVHRLVPVQQASHFVIQSENVLSSGLDPVTMPCVVEITSPNNEKIPCDILPQADGDYRVQWTPTIPGRYTIDVLFGGRQIHGSPFYVDVFDINRIRIGRVKGRMVGEEVTFDVDFGDAGKAEYGLQIIGPPGTGHIPYDVDEKPDGLRVKFNPPDPGRYKVYVTYGGLEVPDCPIIIDVEEARLPTASGDGLVKGEEGKRNTFYVDANNLHGELMVQVEGPNSVAKCTVERLKDDRFAVSYVPVEVGIYNVIVKWNDKEIPGSPFHPNIVDPRKVEVLGGWQHHMDKNDRVILTAGEEKRITFDVSKAGTGQLAAKVLGPSAALIPTRVENSPDNKATVIFTPKEEGAHNIHVTWSDHALVNSPFLGHASISGKYTPDISKVILSGRGLKEAVVHERADFMIDGSKAGPGKPEVRLDGLKHSVTANLHHMGGGKYLCEYTPEVAGAYLLHITWNGRTLKGSPFKVNVLNITQSQKIQVTGEGLKGGMLGKDLSVMIDTRRAGKGDLTAHCMGPTLVATCTLTDMRNGTYKLTIHPQETGKHTLQIMYGGEHVFGSPYVLMIYAQPDPRKVRVHGTGVEHGILANFSSTFHVETKGAGAGELTVRIKGPKGAFQVEMIRSSQTDRRIICHYYPTETGLYIIHVRWSGMEVPGSPFNVQIVDSQEELQRFLSEDYARNTRVNDSGYGWHQEYVPVQ